MNSMNKIRFSSTAKRLREGLNSSLNSEAESEFNIWIAWIAKRHKDAYLLYHSTFEGSSADQEPIVSSLFADPEWAGH